MAKLKAEVLHQSYQGKPVPLRAVLMGHIDRLNPDRLGVCPPGERDLAPAGVSVALGKDARGRSAAHVLPLFAA